MPCYGFWMADPVSPVRADNIHRNDVPRQTDRQAGLILAYFRIANGYEVRSITNSAYYRPGDWLSEGAVAALCASPKWDVTASAPDFSIPGSPVQLPK